MVVDYKHDSSFPYWTSVRRRFEPDPPFFPSGNLERELLAKQVALDVTEGCGLKFKSYKGRQHLVDKHKFPTSFDFFKKAHPSKKKRMKNQQKRRVHKKDEEAFSKMEVENETIDGLVSAVSKLSTSDSSTSNISFGRRNARGLTFVPRSVQPPRKRSDSTTIGEKRVYSRRR